MYQVRVITVFTVFRLLTDFVCLYNYEFWLSLCKIVRSSVILLLPLFSNTNKLSIHLLKYLSTDWILFTLPYSSFKTYTDRVLMTLSRIKVRDSIMWDHMSKSIQYNLLLLRYTSNIMNKRLGVTLIVSKMEQHIN